VDVCGGYGAGVVPASSCRVTFIEVGAPKYPADSIQNRQRLAAEGLASAIPARPWDTRPPFEQASQHHSGPDPPGATFVLLEVDERRAGRKSRNRSKKFLLINRSPG